jgi:HAD superfamily hydrolase (TIGR01458 family)
MLSIPYRSILFDLEGTLYEPSGAIAGAPEAVAAIRKAGLEVRFVTNTTRRSRGHLVQLLNDMGFEASESELFTAVSAAAEWCRSEERRTVLALIRPEATTDLEGLTVLAPPDGGFGGNGRGLTPDAVLVGDFGDSWNYHVLNFAFRCLQAGAALVACQKNRYWMTEEGLALDAGPFVAALEYAAATEAVIVGKPSPLFFRSAVADLAIEPREAVMVGDDVEVDVGGAISAGLAGWLVKTGKYQPGDESRASPWPEGVLSSVSELPEALGLSL